MKKALRGLWNIKYGKPILFASLTALIGLALILTSKAATPTVSFEVETGALSTNATALSDNAASGKSAIKFRSGNGGGTQQTNCAPSPSTCGYADATNTGPVAGTVFKRVPQDITSGPGWAYDSGRDSIVIDWQSDGAIIDGITTSKPIIIDGKNATIKNSILTICNIGDSDMIAIRAGNPSNGYAGDHPVIIHNRLTGCPGSQTTQDQPGRPRSNVRDVYGSAKQAVVIGNDMSGAGNCVSIEYEGYVADNYCHELGHNPNYDAGVGAGDHHSGFSNHGGAASFNWTYNGQTHKGVEYIHNTALLTGVRTTNNGGLSGAITVYGDFARAQNVTVDKNFVAGGAYTMYGGINNESTYGQPFNISLTNNRFICGSWDYGPLFVRATTIVSGNYCDTNLLPVN